MKIGGCRVPAPVSQSVSQSVHEGFSDFHDVTMSVTLKNPETSLKNQDQFRNGLTM